MRRPSVAGSVSLLGAHVSIAGGLPHAVENGLRLGCEAVQIFSKNQRQWRVPLLEDEEAEAFRSAFAASPLEAVTIHDSYLINLADPQKEGLGRAREGFVVEMERAQRLGVPYLVFHPGAHKGKGEAFGLRRIAESLDWCLDRAEAPDVLLLLENTAGQGSTVGYRLEHLQAIRQGTSDPDRLGVCLDTCHLFASGYDLRDEASYQGVMEEVDDVLGLAQVQAFHLNDSKKELDCRVDRHEHIGRGAIGKEGFRLLVNDPRFTRVPMVLETPGEEEEYRRNLEVLRALRRRP